MKANDISRRGFIGMGATGLLGLALAGCGKSGDAGSASSGSGDAKKGSVYYLNFKPEADEQWQALAKAYTEETGIPVSVVTAASDTYEEKLQSEMSKSSAPTLFQVNGPVGLQNWKDYCIDLSGSQVYGELSNPALALKADDHLLQGLRDNAIGVNGHLLHIGLVRREDR